MSWVLFESKREEKRILPPLIVTCSLTRFSLSPFFSDLLHVKKTIKKKTLMSSGVIIFVQWNALYSCDAYLFIVKYLGVRRSSTQQGRRLLFILTKTNFIQVKSTVSKNFKSNFLKCFHKQNETFNSLFFLIVSLKARRESH